MRTIYDRNVSWVEKEKMGTENVSIFLQAVTKHSHLYTKEKVEEIKQVMMNEFPLYVFEGAVLKEFLKNIRLGKYEILLDDIKDLKELFN